MKRFCVVFLSIFLVSTPAYSQSEAGAIFLLIAPGARAGGMGEAQVAVANDAYASYWNPAGLGFLKGTTHKRCGGERNREKCKRIGFGPKPSAAIFVKQSSWSKSAGQIDFWTFF